MRGTPVMHWDTQHLSERRSAMQGAAAAEVFEGLLMLQHRGQDSAGMVTYDCARFCEHKANGLVNDVFQPRDMAALRGAGRRSLPPRSRSLFWFNVVLSRAPGAGLTCGTGYLKACACSP